MATLQMAWLRKKISVALSQMFCQFKPYDTHEGRLTDYECSLEICTWWDSEDDCDFHLFSIKYKYGIDINNVTGNLKISSFSDRNH